MIITRHEKYFLKFVFSDKTIGLNPPSKDSKLKTSKFGADVVLSNIAHPDFNGFEFMNYGDKEAFVIKGAGEYEIADVFIRAYSFKTKFDGEEKMVTSYTMLLDGINVAIFGPINSDKEFSNDAFEDFANADVFILPFGGGDEFSPKEVWKFLKQFGPKVIIPIAEKNELKEFVEEVGVQAEEVDKITLKKKDIPEEGILKIYDLKLAK